MEKTIMGDNSISMVETIPFEIYFFENESDYLAFDVKTYAVLRLSRKAYSVLSLMSKKTIEEICYELYGEQDVKQIVSYYKHFLKLAKRGILSTETAVVSKKKPKFSNIVIMLSGGCNMGCTYCFEKDVPIYQSLNLLSKENADKILDWYFKHLETPNGHIEFYGGEPLLNWSVLKYTIDRVESWAKEKNINFTKYIITNGTMLTKDKAVFFKERGVTVQVSIDGEQEAHDRNRILKTGKPTYEKVCRGILHLINAGTDFNLRAVVTKGNKNVEKLIEALKNIGATNVSFDVVTSDDRELGLSSYDWDEFAASYKKYISNSYITDDERPSDIKKIYKNIESGTKLNYGCGAGLIEVTVTPNGDIYECQRLYKAPYANIDQDISPNELNSNFLTSVDERIECKDCWARYLCGGGCLHQSAVESGSTTPFPMFCKNKRRAVEVAIKNYYEDIVAGKQHRLEVD
jgi:uncharacterized protein